MSLFYINLDKETESRYDLSKFMRYTDNYDPLTSDLLKELKSIPSQGNHRITGIDAGRPDKTSLKLYGDFQYWWILMFYNDINSVEDYSNGKTIQYPTRESLENYYFSLNQRQLGTE
jgi:hypothetical protein